MKILVGETYRTRGGKALATRVNPLLSRVLHLVYILTRATVFHFRQNPPGSLSGKHLGEAAHRLLANSLQMKVESNGHEHTMNGEYHPYAAPMGPPQSLLPHTIYDSHSGYIGSPRPMSAPPPRGPPIPSRYPPTQQYGYNQPYAEPSVYNSHHQSNSYGRNNYERPSSHHYGRNNHSMAHGGRGRGRHSYQAPDANHDARFGNAHGDAPAYNGAYNNHHYGQHSSNFHSNRAPSHQQARPGWVPRASAGGHRQQHGPPQQPTSGHRHQHGPPQQPTNRFSQLDRRSNRNQQPPPYYGR